MTDKDDRKWAWDTRPSDGAPPRPVYIGDKEDWRLEETEKRRDTGLNNPRFPWGGVWTEPLTPGATKAVWGKSTFDSGRYRCCEDMHDCGVFVSVAQGTKKAWHYVRQWTYGFNESSKYKCKNEKNYSGISRHHFIVVNEVLNLLRDGIELGEHDLPVAKLLREQQMPSAPSIEPDIYMEFTNGEWLTVEVIKTSEPSREVHAYCQDRIIELNLNELDCLNDDRAFSKWIQGGGVEALLRENATLEVRKRRYEARENKWKRRDEREFRKEVKVRISACEERYKFNFNGDEESVSRLEDIDGWFEEEQENRRKHEEIMDAIRENEKKYQMEFDDDPSIFDRKEDVDDYFAEQNKPLIEEWEAERKALEEELGMEIPAKYVTSQQMNYFADEKRREAEIELLNQTLPPLIKELEEEVPGLEVNRRFSSLAEFEEYARRKREGFAARQQAQSLSKRIKERYEADVEKLGVEYDTWLARNTKSNAYTLSRINEFIQTAERLLTREYQFKRWQRGYRPAHLVTGNVEGPGLYESSLCRELDKFCKNKDDHTCYSLRSEAAGSLVGCMKLDRNDLRFERIKLFVKSDGLVSWRSRGSIRETREERVKEAQANVERAALALAMKEKREDDERKKRKKGNRAAAPIRGRGRRLDSAPAQKEQDEGDHQDTE